MSKEEKALESVEKFFKDWVESKSNSKATVKFAKAGKTEYCPENDFKWIDGESTHTMYIVCSDTNRLRGYSVPMLKFDVKDNGSGPIYLYGRYSTESQLEQDRMGPHVDLKLITHYFSDVFEFEKNVNSILNTSPVGKFIDEVSEHMDKKYTLELEHVEELIRTKHNFKIKYEEKRYEPRMGNVVVFRRDKNDYKGLHRGSIITELADANGDDVDSTPYEVTSVHEFMESFDTAGKNIGIGIRRL